MDRFRLGFAPFVDFLLIIVIVIIAMVNPPVDPTIELKPKALIQVEWQGHSRSDVDTHVLLPNGEHISYMHKDASGRVTLTRDDLGHSYNSDGDLIATNLEVVEIFALDPGVYTIWVRLFNKKMEKEDPVVRVTFMELGKYDILLDRTVTLHTNKQTISIGKIYVNSKHKIYKVDTDINVRLPG